MFTFQWNFPLIFPFLFASFNVMHRDTDRAHTIEHGLVLNRRMNTVCAMVCTVNSYMKLDFLDERMNDTTTKFMKFKFFP